MKLIMDKANILVESGKVVIDIDSTQLKNILNCSEYHNNISRITDISSSTSDLVYLSTLKPKDEFKIGNEIFIALEQNNNTTKVISKEFAYNNKHFGNCSDWKKSPIRTLLNEVYYNKIAKFVGISNIIPMERDLTSLDGLDDFGTCIDKISLLSVSEYAKYHKILGLKFNYSNWWWTITPASTPSNDNCSCCVCYVCTHGTLDWCDCGCCMAVRPFFTLNSSILVSLNKE